MTLEIRSLQLRAEDINEDAREITGLAVPWDQDAQIGDLYAERWEKDALEVRLGGAKFKDLHGQSVGVVTRAESTDAGLEITARVSDTQQGRDVLTLARDGVYGHLSIGFEPKGHRIEQREDGVEVVVRTAAVLHEVSAVDFPAYDGAAISEVRSAATPTTPDDRSGNTKEAVIVTDAIDHATAADLTEVRSSVEDLERRMAVLGEGSSSSDTPAPLEYRSLGHFVKALAAQGAPARDHVETLNRAYTGATTGDVAAQNKWMERDIHLVEDRRPIVNLFHREALPGEGMVLEYPTFTSKSGDVAKQAVEGDDLSYLELVVGTASTNVETYGGYSELTRQTIERRPVSYLNSVLRMQAISYAKQTNGIVRSKLTGATGTNTVIDISGTNDEAVAWTGAIIDAVGNIESNSVLGLGLDFLLVSTAQFKVLNSVVDSTGRPIFTLNGDGQNTIGSLNVKGLSASISGVPVVVDPLLTGLHAYGCSRDALTILESPGAPFRLDDENIVNLSKAYSVYGYLAATLDDAKAIQKIKVLSA